VPVDLKNFIGSHECILFAGIGNVLRNDDGIGVYIACRLVERERIKAIVVEVSIENYIGRINAIPHDVLVLIDAVDFKKEPGYFALLTPREITDFTITTHNISIPGLLMFFRSPLFILGIQPQSVDFGENLAEPVKRQADTIIALINAC
jgi:hydrogenase maturation protease